MQDISDPKRPGRGYLAAVFGSLGAAAVGAVAAGGLAAVVIRCEGSGLECLGIVLGIAAPIAAIAGAAVVARRIAIGSPTRGTVIDTKGDDT